MLYSRKTNQLFGGYIVNKVSKMILGYSIGVVIAIVAMSLWRNEGLNLQLMFGMILGGLIGIFIVSGITMYIKKAKEKASENK